MTKKKKKKPKEIIFPKNSPAFTKSPFSKLCNFSAHHVLFDEVRSMTLMKSVMGSNLSQIEYDRKRLCLSKTFLGKLMSDYRWTKQYHFGIFLSFYLSDLRSIVLSLKSILMKDGSDSIVGVVGPSATKWQKQTCHVFELLLIQAVMRNNSDKRSMSVYFSSQEDEQRCWSLFAAVSGHSSINLSNFETLLLVISVFLPSRFVSLLVDLEVLSILEQESFPQSCVYIKEIFDLGVPQAKTLVNFYPDRTVCFEVSTIFLRWTFLAQGFNFLIYADSYFDCRHGVFVKDMTCLYFEEFDFFLSATQIHCSLATFFIFDGFCDHGICLACCFRSYLNNLSRYGELCFVIALISYKSLGCVTLLRSFLAPSFSVIDCHWDWLCIVKISLGMQKTEFGSTNSSLCEPHFYDCSLGGRQPIPTFASPKARVLTILCLLVKFFLVFAVSSLTPNFAQSNVVGFYYQLGILWSKSKFNCSLFNYSYESYFLATLFQCDFEGSQVIWWIGICLSNDYDFYYLQ